MTTIRTARTCASWSTARRCRDDAAAYQRIVLLFDGEDDDAVAAARGAWSEAKAKGFEVTYWQPDEQGRWEKKA